MSFLPICPANDAMWAGNARQGPSAWINLSLCFLFFGPGRDLRASAQPEHDPRVIRAPGPGPLQLPCRDPAPGGPTKGRTKGERRIVREKDKVVSWWRRGRPRNTVSKIRTAPRDDEAEFTGFSIGPCGLGRPFIKLPRHHTHPPRGTREGSVCRWFERPTWAVKAWPGPSNHRLPVR